MQMKMRDLNPEFEQDRAIGSRDVEERAFGDFLHSRELLRLGVGEIGEIFDVTGDDEHRMASHGGIGVKEKLPVAEVDDELAG